MATIDNLVNKLCVLALTDKPDYEVKEWRLLGQEQNGTLLFTWIETNPDPKFLPISHIGLYSYISNTLDIIKSFDSTKNTIQASINANRTILAYVVKDLPDEHSSISTYKPFLLNIQKNEIISLNIERSKQIMMQFLYKKQTVLNEKQDEKLLVLIHEECIIQYQLKAKDKDAFNLESFLLESLARVFMWAQWDPVNQILYYIHYRKPIKSLVEDETEVVTSASFKVTPTLSGLQFHDDLPHETVLNIPLNLPHLSTLSADCAIYEDDTVPLRIHNCSLDLIVLTTKNGAVFVCHHYLYQPVNPPTKLHENDEAPVHFAYSITALHQSCIVHCVIPGIPWNLARTIRPLFIIYEDHLLVFIPTICTQLLDLGMIHEPCNHVTTTADLALGCTSPVSLTPLISGKFGTYGTLNTATLDLVDVHVTTAQLLRTFKSAEATLPNKLAIVHYMVLHLGEVDVVTELLSEEVEKPLKLGFPQLLKEFLIATTYATVKRSMPADANELINLLPITIQPVGCETETKIGDKVITLSQDALWNATMMLLSPQQRIVPYRADIWVKLWDHLIQNARGKIRFKPSQVVDKLMVSLVCYQPEALSRSSTPMSPGGSLSVATASDMSLMKSQIDSLPFCEFDSCTASKQEHIISVNLRELSMHLLKQSTDSRVNRYQWQSQTPLHVHAVATRYITAQLEQSRYLCQIMCKAATEDARYVHDKGFVFIDQLSNDKQFLLFTTLERYYLAVESIAFPFPLGFTSFFAYLGYRTLSYNMFLQYVNKRVFELHVDVMKIIMTDIDDTREGVNRKLKLLSMLPRSRANRLMNQWNHPISYMLRAREHATNILSGLGAGNNARGHTVHKTRHQKLDFSAFSIEGRVSPLDTFFDLLTAKASLSDLDFGLLIEAMSDKIEHMYED